MGSPTPDNRRFPGFTVVEILIVIALLSIVAITVVPQFSNAGDEARMMTVEEDLAIFRQQIDRYREDHNGTLPAHGSTSEAEFVAHLNQRTTPDGALDPAGRCGPYLVGRMPPNVYTGRRGILVVPGMLQPSHLNGSGEHGWAYSSTSGEFRISVPSDVTDQKGRTVNSF